jgi:hypothetical protein
MNEDLFVIRWKEVPCHCGFTTESNPEKFEKYAMEMATCKIGGYSFPKRIVDRCQTCKKSFFNDKAEKLIILA